MQVRAFTSLQPFVNAGDVLDVAFWPLADVEIMPTDVRYQAQSRHHADMLECRLLTHSGHRPFDFAVLHSNSIRCGRLSSPQLGEGHEAARVHKACWWFSGCMAARVARAGGRTGAADRRVDIDS